MAGRGGVKMAWFPSEVARLNRLYVFRTKCFVQRSYQGEKIMVCRTSVPAGLRTQKVPDGPAFNVWKSDAGASVTAELPGLDLEKLDISIVGDTVTIQGQKAAENFAEETRVQRRERSVGQFTRTLKLPFRVDAARSEATYSKGLLTVTLPSLEDDKRKQIAVKSA